ncbi:pantetheine-phosphate adenylyltransferase [Corynebacterium sphenisci]|uniref:pantetheine-phosphate adenylyltransferase n=1 Tax=Corynebacterium sphenisci TaxID=191493 RepID=UPI0026DF6046|nr:pantetheine-phosphate adenylyltransferase [Corynebacterium sphenisci]MDO5731487.1 pantetheine-phosphate adenylyltransferase [Corynebacterium sphenisci]
MTRACFPGSFDPVTMGHVDVARRACAQFEEVTMLVTHNPAKTGMFTPEERMRLIADSTPGLDNLRVDSWTGLLVDYTTAHGITVLVKGLRSALDYEYELPMAQMNRRLSGVETMFLLTDPRYGYTSSTLCKEVAGFGGDLTGLVPDPVAAALRGRAGRG